MESGESAAGRRTARCARWSPRRGSRGPASSPSRRSRSRSAPAARAGGGGEASPRCTDSTAAQSCWFVRSQNSTAYAGSVSGRANSHWHSTSVRSAAQRHEPVRQDVVRVQPTSAGSGTRPTYVTVRGSTPGSVTAPGPDAPSKRHRLGVRLAGPSCRRPRRPGRCRCRPDVGDGDRAQLRMDHRAVVALVVVLRDQLPVGRDLVAVGGVDVQPLRAVRRDVVVELADERRRTVSAPPAAFTNSQPCQSTTGSRLQAPRRPCRSPAPSPARPRSEPSSRYAHPWYGQTIARAVRPPCPTGSSSCPRCRHTLANARTVSSPDRP